MFHRGDAWLCFFFKQKTAYEMRISDWSSDVCSSDLLVQGLLDDGTVQLEPLTFIRGRTFARTFAILDEAQNVEYGVLRSLASRLGEGSKQIGRASCRERGCQ